MDEAAAYEPSAYWQQEVEGFDYMFDASPLVIGKLREHEYHLTGLRSYEYRRHHADYARRFASKLRRLREVDPGNLFVPESEALGGFGHGLGVGSWDLINSDSNSRICQQSPPGLPAPPALSST